MVETLSVGSSRPIHHWTCDFSLELRIVCDNPSILKRWGGGLPGPEHDVCGIYRWQYTDQPTGRPASLHGDQLSRWSDAGLSCTCCSSSYLVFWRSNSDSLSLSLSKRMFRFITVTYTSSNVSQSPLRKKSVITLTIWRCTYKMTPFNAPFRIFVVLAVCCERFFNF